MDGQDEGVANPLTLRKCHQLCIFSSTGCCGGRPSECLVPGEWTGIEERKEVFMTLNHLLMEWHGYLKE